MKRIIILSVLFTYAILIGCKEKSQIQKSTELIFITKDKISTVEKIEFDDVRFIDSCDFIPLETSEIGLIGEITQIEYCNDKYYIYDQRTTKLKVFDSTGSFLFDIGKKGEGPGEYLAINSFFINEKENKIGIFDPSRLAVHEYNINGEFIQTVKHNQKSLISVNKSICAGDYIYCSFDVSHINDMTYSSLSANDYSIVNRWSPYPVKVSTQMASALIKHSFCLVKGELHYLTLYSDTIYSYHNGKEQPYFIIETGKPNIPQTYFEGKPFENEPMDAFWAVWRDERYSPGFDKFFETDRYIMAGFSPNNDFYLVDKDKKEAFYVKEDIFPGLVMPTLINNNKLIKVFDQQEITAYQNFITSNNLEYPEQIRELMSKYDVDEDNPILIIYHMKKSEK